MKYLPLIWAALWRKPVRTVFTFLSIVAAFVLFGILGGLNVGYQALLAGGRMDRLNSNTRNGDPLPMSYTQQIERVPGVRLVAPLGFVPAYYQDQKNRAALTGSDERFFAARSEANFPQALMDKWKATRDGLIVTTEMAQKFGWKPGDKIPMQSPEKNVDGSNVFSFTLVGTVPDTPGGFRTGIMLVHYDYLDASRTTNKGTVVRFLVMVNDPERATGISREVDKLFANSPAATRTNPERVGQRANRQEVFDVDFFTEAVIGAGLFMLLFLTANVMMQAVKDRIPEFAVLKTVGFTGGGIIRLVMAEAQLLCLAGAAIGLAIAWAFAPFVVEFFPYVERFAPRISWPVISIGLLVAACVAFLSAALPAFRAKNLSVVDGLTTR